MTIIFGTTNERKIEDLRNVTKKVGLDLDERKIEDLRNVTKKIGLDLDIKSLTDIGWDRGDIEENGSTLEENSLIKATTIYNFCKDNDINYPILTDDTGLFVESLNGEPGIYTGRYAQQELEQDDSLPKYECVNKLLRNLKGILNRNAYYKCVVTCMFQDGTYFQEFGISEGEIVENIVEPLRKPYFYSVFKLISADKTFNLLNEEELSDTYRYSAFNKVLTKLKKL